MNVDDTQVAKAVAQEQIVTPLNGCVVVHWYQGEGWGGGEGEGEGEMLKC